MSSSRDKSSAETSRLEAKIAKHRAVCVEFQQRADEVLTDMQAYTFAVRQLLEAKARLSRSLESVLALPRTGSGFWDYASSWIDATGIQVASEPDIVVSGLKMAANGAQKISMAQFANINSILSHYDTHPTKPGVAERVLDDVKSFNEQRMTTLESPIVELLNLEYNVGLGMNSTRMVEKLAEAQQRFAESQSQPLPKSELVLEPLLKNIHTIHYLRQFYESEHSAENLDLWFAVQRYKQINDLKQRAAEAENIFQTFICDNSPKQVNLPMKVLRDVTSGMKTIRQKLEENQLDAEIVSVDLFDDAAKECFTLLKSRFGKFVDSKFGKQLKCRIRDIRPFEQYVEAKSDPDVSAAMRKIKKLRTRGTSVGEKDSGLLQFNSNTVLTTDIHFSLQEKHKVTVKPTALLRVQTEMWCAFQDGTIVCYLHDKNEIRAGRTLMDPKDASPVSYMIRIGSNEVLTLHEEGVIKVWDAVKGKVAAKTGGSKTNTFFSVIQKTGDPGSFWAVSAKSITSFTYKKKKITSEVTRETGRVITSLLRVQNAMWMGDQDGGLSRWNIQTLQPIGQRIREQNRAVHVLQLVETHASSQNGFNSVNRYIWAASRDCSICIFSEDFTLLRKISVGMSLPVTSIVVLPDSPYVVTSSEDHNVVLWKKDIPSIDGGTSNGSDLLVERLPAVHKDSVGSLCYADDAEQLWCAASDRVIAVWNRVSKKGKLESRSGSSLGVSPRSTDSISDSPKSVSLMPDSIAAAQAGSSSASRSSPVILTPRSKAQATETSSTKSKQSGDLERSLSMDSDSE